MWPRLGSEPASRVHVRAIIEGADEDARGLDLAPFLRLEILQIDAVRDGPHGSLGAELAI